MKTSSKTHKVLLRGVISVMMLTVLAFLTTTWAGAAVSKVFDQCANDNGLGVGQCVWIGSIINAGKGQYSEGMAVPQRIMWENIASGNVHTVTFSAQWSKGGKHSSDFLVSYDDAVTLASIVRAQTMVLNPCANLPSAQNHDVDCPVMRSGLYSMTVGIPDDPFQSAGCASGYTCYAQDKINAYKALFPSAYALKLYTKTPISGAKLTVAHDVANLGDTGDSDILYTLVYTTTSLSDALLVETGEHLSIGTIPNQPLNLQWGPGQGGASLISGAPYHFKTPQFDGVGGSTDNQLDLNANSPPVPELATRNSGVAGKTLGQSITDTLTITGTSPISGTVAFFVCGPTASFTPCLTGSPVPVTKSVNVASTTATVISDAFTPTQNGTYCFRVLFTSQNTANSSGNSISSTNECATFSASTAVRLSSMRGSRAESGAVALNWVTGSEINTAGFNLYRAESAGGPYTRINAQLIPAVNTVTGNAYQYEDATALPGKTYYYQLEDVELNGRITRHDPIALNAPEANSQSGALPIALGVGLGAFVVIAGGLFITLKKLNVF